MEVPDPLPDIYPCAILLEAMGSRISHIRVTTVKNPKYRIDDARVDWKIGDRWLDSTLEVQGMWGPIDERFFRFLRADPNLDEHTLENFTTFKDIRRLYARRIRGELPALFIDIEYHQPGPPDYSNHTFRVKDAATFTNLPADATRIEISQHIHVLPLSELAGARHIKIGNCTVLKSLTTLANLESLEIGCSEETADLSPLKSLKNLSVLEISVVQHPCGLNVVNEMVSLEKLSLNVRHIKEGLNFRALNRLSDLSFYTTTGLPDLDFLAHLPSLKTAHLDIHDLQNIQALETCSKLERLEIVYYPSLDSRPLFQLHNLKELFLYADRCGADAIRGKAEKLSNELKESLPNCKVEFDLWGIDYIE